MTDHWLPSAFTNDVIVADLLLQLKHSSNLSYSDPDSLKRRSQSTTTTSVTSFLPPRWGHRKNRSKSTSPTGKELRRSPTTHLSWSAGGSSSDGCDESRPSDLSSGCRSVKVNEAAFTSSNKSEKRKVFSHEQELTSIRVPLNQQVAASDNLKRIKCNLDRDQRNKTQVMREHERQMKLHSLAPIPCSRIEAEKVGPQKGFVLPDLNMTPSEEDLAMMS